MVDIAIIGAGLAGSTLAWAARHAGLSVALVDRGDVSASRVAAGLVTPVTGQRLVKTLQHDRLMPKALHFYHEVERVTNTYLVHPQAIVRLFRTDKERAVFAQRQNADFEGLVRMPEPPLDEEQFETASGSFEMPTAWRLDVPAYLDATAKHFSTHVYTADINPECDILLSQSGISILPLNLKAKHVVLCQGFAGWQYAGIKHVPHNHAKGEVLELRIPLLKETRIVNRGIWLAPLGNNLAMAGATYEWDDLTPLPTQKRREEIEIGLKDFVKVPWEVTNHQGAVRAITADRNPILGRVGSNCYVFSGLGSKGVLWAPYYADHLLKHFLRGEALDKDVDIQRWKTP